MQLFKIRFSIFILYLLVFSISQQTFAFSYYNKDDRKDKAERLAQLYNLYNIQYKDSFHLGYKYATEALSISKELNNTQHEISASIYLGSYYNVWGALTKSEQFYNNAFDLNAKIKNPFFFAKIYLGKAVLQFKKSNADSCLILINKGLDFAKSINNKTLIGYGYRYAGLAFDMKGEKLNALKYFQLALDFYKEDKKVLASIYGQMGIIYGDAGKTELATKYFNMALKIREEMNEYDMMGYLYSNLAGIYGANLNYEKGIEYNLLALSVFEKINDKKGLGYVLNNIGAAYFSTNRFDKALEYFRRSLFFRNQLTDKQAIAFTLTNIGETYLKKNIEDSSFYYLKKSLRISKETNDKLSTSATYNTLGKFYNHQKKYREAIKYLNECIRITKQINYMPQLEDCYQQLSEIYKKLNQPQQALEYLQLHNQLHDSIFSAKAQSYIANAQVKYETERLERKENIGNKLQINRIVTGSLIVLLSILTGGTLYYYKNKILPKLKIADIISSFNMKRIKEDKRKFKSVEAELTNRSESHKNNIDSEILNSISEGLSKLLDEERIFLTAGLGQNEIAKRLNTNTTYLSKVINEKYQTNFSNLINSYRIEEAKRLILANTQNILTYEGIATESGFNSKSSFNAAFKKFTGTTPTEFAKSLAEIKK